MSFKKYPGSKMEKKFNYSIIFIVLILIALASFVSSSNFLSMGSNGDTNGQPKDFTLLDLSGNSVTLSQLVGKPVIINFWATWCPPCVAEMPALNEIYLSNKQKDLVILGVNVAEKEEWVRKFTQKLNLSFPILLDPESEVNDKYRVYGLPTSFFLDRKGNIKEMIMGGASKKILMDKVQSIL